MIAAVELLVSEIDSHCPPIACKVIQKKKWNPSPTLINMTLSQQATIFIEVTLQNAIANPIEGA